MNLISTMIKFALSLSFITLWASACSEGVLFSDLSKSAPAVEGEKTGDSSDEVDQPQSIAGAFLTCQSVTASESGLADGSGVKHIGCAVKKDHIKVNMSPLLTMKMELADLGGANVVIQTKDAPSNSSWHKYALILQAQKGVIKMSVTSASDPAGVPLKFNLDKLDLVDLLIVKGTKSWDMDAGPGNVYNGIVTSGLCVNGVVNEKVDSIFTTGGVIPIVTALNPGPISMTAQQCFKEFDKLQDTGFTGQPDGPTAAVQAGDGCLFVKSGEGKIIIFGKVDQAKYGITEPGLLKAVMAKPCP